MIKLSAPKFGTNLIAKTLLKYKYKVKPDDILAGTVIGIEKTQNLVNLGLKKVAFLPTNEIFIDKIKNSTQMLSINIIGEFIILLHNFKINKTIISFKKLHHKILWERFKQIDIKNMRLLMIFKQSIKGGKILTFDDLEVFIPNLHQPKYNKRKNLASKLIKIKILKVEVKNQKYYILGSSRLSFFKEQSSSLQRDFKQIAYIIRVKPFGIFLNIYGIKCLLHISEISNKKIEDIYKLYKKGDKIKVKIIYINNDQGKIALSAKNF